MPGRGLAEIRAGVTVRIFTLLPWRLTCCCGRCVFCVMRLFIHSPTFLEGALRAGSGRNKN